MCLALAIEGAVLASFGAVHGHFVTKAAHTKTTRFVAIDLLVALKQAGLIRTIPTETFGISVGGIFGDCRISCRFTSGSEGCWLFLIVVYGSQTNESFRMSDLDMYKDRKEWWPSTIESVHHIDVCHAHVNVALSS